MRKWVSPPLFFGGFVFPIQLYVTCSIFTGNALYFEKFLCKISLLYPTSLNASGTVSFRPFLLLYFIPTQENFVQDRGFSPNPEEKTSDYQNLVTLCEGFSIFELNWQAYEAAPRKNEAISQWLTLVA